MIWSWDRNAMREVDRRFVGEIDVTWTVKGLMEESKLRYNTERDYIVVIPCNGSANTH